MISGKEQRIRDGVKKWTGFYRANPHRFVLDYLGIKLHMFQKILIYMCFHVNYFMYLASNWRSSLEIMKLNLVNLEI